MEEGCRDGRAEGSGVRAPEDTVQVEAHGDDRNETNDETNKDQERDRDQKNGDKTKGREYRKGKKKARRKRRDNSDSEETQVKGRTLDGSAHGIDSRASEAVDLFEGAKHQTFCIAKDLLKEIAVQFRENPQASREIVVFASNDVDSLVCSHTLYNYFSRKLGILLRLFVVSTYTDLAQQYATEIGKGCSKACVTCFINFGARVHLQSFLDLQRPGDNDGNRWDDEGKWVESRFPQNLWIILDFNRPFSPKYLQQTLQQQNRRFHLGIRSLLLVSEEEFASYEQLVALYTAAQTQLSRELESRERPRNAAYSSIVLDENLMEPEWALPQPGDSAKGAKGRNLPARLQPRLFNCSATLFGGGEYFGTASSTVLYAALQKAYRPSSRPFACFLHAVALAYHFLNLSLSLQLYTDLLTTLELELVRARAETGAVSNTQNHLLTGNVAKDQRGREKDHTPAGRADESVVFNANELRVPFFRFISPRNALSLLPQLLTSRSLRDLEYSLAGMRLDLDFRNEEWNEPASSAVIKRLTDNITNVVGRSGLYGSDAAALRRLGADLTVPVLLRRLNSEQGCCGSEMGGWRLPEQISSLEVALMLGACIGECSSVAQGSVSAAAIANQSKTFLEGLKFLEDLDNRAGGYGSTLSCLGSGDEGGVGRGSVSAMTSGRVMRNVITRAMESYCEVDRHFKKLLRRRWSGNKEFCRSYALKNGTIFEAFLEDSFTPRTSRSPFLLNVLIGNLVLVLCRHGFKAKVPPHSTEETLEEEVRDRGSLQVALFAVPAQPFLAEKASIILHATDVSSLNPFKLGFAFRSIVQQTLRNLSQSFHNSSYLLCPRGEHRRIFNFVFPPLRARQRAVGGAVGAGIGASAGGSADNETGGAETKPSGALGTHATNTYAPTDKGTYGDEDGDAGGTRRHTHTHTHTHEGGHGATRAQDGNSRLGSQISDHGPAFTQTNESLMSLLYGRDAATFTAPSVAPTVSANQSQLNGSAPSEALSTQPDVGLSSRPPSPDGLDLDAKDQAVDARQGTEGKAEGEAGAEAEVTADDLRPSPNKRQDMSIQQESGDREGNVIENGNKTGNEIENVNESGGVDGAPSAALTSRKRRSPTAPMEVPMDSSLGTAPAAVPPEKQSTPQSEVQSSKFLSEAVPVSSESRGGTVKSGGGTVEPRTNTVSPNIETRRVRGSLAARIRQDASIAQGERAGGGLTATISNDCYPQVRLERTLTGTTVDDENERPRQRARTLHQMNLEGESEPVLFKMRMGVGAEAEGENGELGPAQRAGEIAGASVMQSGSSEDRSENAALSGVEGEKNGIDETT